MNRYVNAEQRLEQINLNLISANRKSLIIEEKAIPTRKANMHFNYLVGTKRLKSMLTFLVGAIGFFLTTIFSAVLIAWKATFSNILMINKKIIILLALGCIISVIVL